MNSCEHFSEGLCLVDKIEVTVIGDIVEKFIYGVCWYKFKEQEACADYRPNFIGIIKEIIDKESKIKEK